MKTLLLILTVVLCSTSSFARADEPGSANAALPVCSPDDAPTGPCKMDKNGSLTAYADMLIGNAQGFAAILKKAPGRLAHQTGGFLFEDVRASFQKEENNIDPTNHNLSRSTMVYEVLFQDCRGTDQCGGTYLWTVTEVSTSDGYSYDSTYTDTLEATRLEELN